MSLSSYKNDRQGLVRHLLRESRPIVYAGLALFLLTALFTYSPNDPGFCSTGAIGAAGISNEAGRYGANTAGLLFGLLGYLAYLLPLWLGYGIYTHLRGSEPSFHWPLFLLRTLAFLLLLLASCGLATLHFGTDPNLPIDCFPAHGGSAGGIVGAEVQSLLSPRLAIVGSTLLLFMAALFGLTVVMAISWLRVVETLGGWVLGGLSLLGSGLSLLGTGLSLLGSGLYRLVWGLVLFITWPLRWPLSLLAGWRERQGGRGRVSRKPSRARQRTPPTITDPLGQIGRGVAASLTPALTPAPTPARRAGRRRAALGSDPTADLPSVGLLDAWRQGDAVGFSQESLQSMAELLETKLRDFGIDITVTAIHPGPVITRFEVQPAPGIKVSRISNLVKDLARSLAVVSVRVVEVIPGKTVIGIEIPNERRELIRLSQLLASKEFRNADSSLSMALGHDIVGKPIIVDLARMPHLLVAGTTGSGKSVGINAMILSLLFKSVPEQVRMIMIDPKMLELSVYEGIPHLLTPVITDMKDAANGLRWCVAEMERRYRLMSELGVRNLAGYNRRVDEAVKAGAPLLDPLWQPQQSESETECPELEPLPCIVVVIDELADLMMVVGKKVEELIARIAQKARAAGIHLIVATQRPSVDVLTGLIKANIPTRLSFMVQSKVDSRTILGEGGAEQLLGNGDMLFLPPGGGVPTRVHGAFVSDGEVHRVAAEWKAKRPPEYMDVTSQGGGEGYDLGNLGPLAGENDGDEGEDDALYDEAVRFVTESRKASISSVQRKLRIGYNRAARMIDSMEQAGVVSAMGSNGVREVIAPPPGD